MLISPIKILAQLKTANGYKENLVDYSIQTSL